MKAKVSSIKTNRNVIYGVLHVLLSISLLKFWISNLAIIAFTLEYSQPSISLSLHFCSFLFTIFIHSKATPTRWGNSNSSILPFILNHKSCDYLVFEIYFAAFFQLSKRNKIKKKSRFKSQQRKGGRKILVIRYFWMKALLKEPRKMKNYESRTKNRWEAGSEAKKMTEWRKQQLSFSSKQVVLSKQKKTPNRNLRGRE